MEAADVVIVTGKSYRQALRMLNIIKLKLKKEKHHLISVSEFCVYYNLPVDEVLKSLNRQ